MNTTIVTDKERIEKIETFMRNALPDWWTEEIVWLLSICKERGLEIERLKKRVHELETSSLKFHITINNMHFEHPSQFISGRQIKEYVGAPARYGAWLKSADGDIQIMDEERTDLSHAGRKHWFTGPLETTEGKSL